MKQDIKKVTIPRRRKVALVKENLKQDTKKGYNPKVQENSFSEGKSIVSQCVILQAVI